MTTKKEWAAIIGLILVMIVGGIIEPCDGHSCKQTTEAQQ